MAGPFPITRLRREFDKADKDKKGFLTYDQALAIFSSGEGHDTELEEIMGRLMDRNYDGKITFDELVEFAKRMHDAEAAALYKRFIGAPRLKEGLSPNQNGKEPEATDATHE